MNFNVYFFAIAATAEDDIRSLRLKMLSSTLNVQVQMFVDL